MWWVQCYLRASNKLLWWFCVSIRYQKKGYRQQKSCYLFTIMRKLVSNQAINLQSITRPGEYSLHQDWELGPASAEWSHAQSTKGPFIANLDNSSSNKPGFWNWLVAWAKRGPLSEVKWSERSETIVCLFVCLFVDYLIRYGPPSSLNVDNSLPEITSAWSLRASLVYECSDLVLSTKLPHPKYTQPAILAVTRVGVGVGATVSGDSTPIVGKGSVSRLVWLVSEYSC